MKISYLYDQGSAQYREDGLFIADPFCGVLDGVSAPFGPKHPIRKFNGLSGGEFVARSVEQFFSTATPESYLSAFMAISQANNFVRNLQEKAGVEIKADKLAGATFAIALLNQDYVEVIQAGDCFALWVMKNGLIDITKNQVRLHDTEMQSTILKLQREVAHKLYGIQLEKATVEQRNIIRGEMWNRFFSILSEARIQDVNRLDSPRCYGLLNGQPELLDATFRICFNRNEIQAILLFSDGMVPWEAMKEMADEEVAEKVLADYREGGLPHLLRIARGIENRVKMVNYTDSAEATAIAIEF